MKRGPNDNNNAQETSLNKKAKVNEQPTTIVLTKIEKALFSAYGEIINNAKTPQDGGNT
ncbi:MAG: hypothetical protein JSS07_11055 [Proteobacteria bacterium]|nr:hypothetical protein [Pseudomonadota bacterium]